MTSATVQIPIPVTVLFEAVKLLSPTDKSLLRQLLEEEAENSAPDASYHYPLKALPIEIAEDFDEPMPELWP